MDSREHARQFATQLGDRAARQLPLSFIYGGRTLAEHIPTWRLVAESDVTADSLVRRSRSFRDPATGLVARIESVAYSDFASVEWTLFLRNAGAADTPIVESIQAIDASFERTPNREFVLHHAAGSPALASDYAPKETILKRSLNLRITTAGGRSSDTDLPYFSLADENGGVVIAMGWPGQWAVRFVRDNGTNVQVTGGQERTHFVLHPGEEVRAPLIALVFYDGDWVDGQNEWRRWLIAHNLPRIDGDVPRPFISAASSNQFNEMEEANEENQNRFVDRYLAEKIPLDYWWMDAGWYKTQTGRWVEVGT